MRMIQRGEVPAGRREFFQVGNNVTELLKLPKMNEGLAFTYIVLLRYYNEKYGYAYPTQEQLAKDLFTTERTIKSRLKTLHEIGLIKYEKSPEGGRNKVVYFYDLDDIYARYAEESDMSWI